MLESRGIGVGSSPIGCEGFMKASKVQGSSLLLSKANNFVGYSYIYISTVYIWITVNSVGIIIYLQLEFIKPRNITFIVQEFSLAT